MTLSSCQMQTEYSPGAFCGQGTEKRLGQAQGLRWHAFPHTTTPQTCRKPVGSQPSTPSLLVNTISTAFGHEACHTSILHCSRATQTPPGRFCLAPFQLCYFNLPVFQFLLVLAHPHGLPPGLAGCPWWETLCTWSGCPPELTDRWHSVRFFLFQQPHTLL